MSQISPPIRIVLGAAIAFLAVYMVLLRPKTDATPTPAPAANAGNVNTGAPAETGFGKAVEAAKSAAAATDAASAKSDAASEAAGSDSATQSATGSAAGTANGSTTPPATAASAKATGLPLPVLKAVADHKVLALLFWNPKSPDDRLVHAALKRVERFDGEVFVHSAPISKVSRYARITRGADVEQASTVVIVDRKLRSSNLVGYVNTLAIDQAVVDALRASGGLFKSEYLKRVNATCSATIHDYVALPQSTTAAQAPTVSRAHAARFDTFVKRLHALPAPARLRGFHRTFVGDAAAIQAELHASTHRLGAHPSVARYNAEVTRLDHNLTPLEKRFNRHANAQDLVFCGSLG